MICKLQPNAVQSPFHGCDFVVQLGEERKNTPVKLLQLTDMQWIDASQRRTPDRLRPDEIAAWDPANFDAQCGNQIRSLVTQTKPDLIFITGDIVYGSFDDSGSALEWICAFMDSFRIPWAPVFGNHDNESKRGVAWQCAQFEESEYCLFKRGEVSGNCNYAVGIAAGDQLLRVLYMTDSNGCWDSDDPAVLRYPGIYPDQLALIREKTRSIRAAQGGPVPGFMAFHIPTVSFMLAEETKGYTAAGKDYTLGVDMEAKDDDFGFRHEQMKPIRTDEDFEAFLHENGIDGVFVGHYHKNCTCIRYEGVRFVFGLKTGQYDYHLPGSLGGTLVTLRGDTFEVCHVPALASYAPMPSLAPMFRNFFA